MVIEILTNLIRNYCYYCCCCCYCCCLLLLLHLSVWYVEGVVVVAWCCWDQLSVRHCSVVTVAPVQPPPPPAWSPSPSSSSWQCPACLPPPPSFPPVLTRPAVQTILSVVPALPRPRLKTRLLVIVGLKRAQHIFNFTLFCRLWQPTLQLRPLWGPSRPSSLLEPRALWGPAVILDPVGSVDPRAVWLSENKFYILTCWSLYFSHNRAVQSVHT